MRKQETAFISKITTGVTHEFMNVLSTIKESSGLMEDLLTLSGDASFSHQEKFSKTLIIIKKQVRRGMEISGMLNKFAHSMEEPEATIEINELLDQIAILMQRFASLKQVRLTINPLETPLEIRIDPFRLQLILAGCLEYCFDRTASGGDITLQSKRTKNGITFQCMMQPDSNSMENVQDLLHEFEEFQETLTGLNAQLSPISSPGQQGLELILPLMKK